MRAFGAILAMVATMALAGCGGGGGSGEETPAPPAADTMTSWSQVSATNINVPEGVFYTIVDVGGEPAAEISNVPADASSAQRTGGVSVRLPDDIEQAAGGHQVRVTIRAAALQEGSVIAVAYSTNDTGNSEWRQFPLTTTPAEYSFTYDVPPVQTGNGDYLGFRSYNQGRVQVLGYKVEVVN